MLQSSWGFFLISRNELQKGLRFALKPPIFFCPLSITPDWTVSLLLLTPFFKFLGLPLIWNLKKSMVLFSLVKSVKNHPLCTKNQNFSNIEPHRAFPLSKLESTSFFRGCKGRETKRTVAQPWAWFIPVCRSSIKPRWRWRQKFLPWCRQFPLCIPLLCVSVCLSWWHDVNETRLCYPW